MRNGVRHSCRQHWVVFLPSSLRRQSEVREHVDQEDGGGGVLPSKKRLTGEVGKRASTENANQDH